MISLVRMSASFWMRSKCSLEKCSSIIREETGNSHGFERGAFLFSQANKAFEADKKPQENFVIAMARAGPRCSTSICNINVERPRHAAVFEDGCCLNCTVWFAPRRAS
jgi:hypothetical protein